MLLLESLPVQQSDHKCKDNFDTMGLEAFMWKKSIQILLSKEMRRTTDGIKRKCQDIGRKKEGL